MWTRQIYFLPFRKLPFLSKWWSRDALWRQKLLRSYRRRWRRGHACGGVIVQVIAIKTLRALLVAVRILLLVVQRPIAPLLRLLLNTIKIKCVSEQMLTESINYSLQLIPDRNSAEECSNIRNRCSDCRSCLLITIQFVNDYENLLICSGHPDICC